MSQPTRQFIITVMARDRVGIVYEVASSLSSIRGDLADVRQQVLQGYLTMILYATFPDSVDEEQIRTSMQNAWTDEVHPPEISIKAVLDPPKIEAHDIPRDAYIMTVRGQDRIGFVATVAGFCARNRINILDLSTTVAEDAYVMILLVDLSRCGDIKTLRDGIDDFNRNNDLNLILQHHDIFKATNEIRMI